MRFTPTGVGTTHLVRSLIAMTSVHPHGRGDHHGTFSARSMSAGSPPRAWGPLYPPIAPFFLCRFTPTGVGTTPGP